MFSSFVGLGLKYKSSHRATNTLRPCIHVLLIFCLLFVYACAVMCCLGACATMHLRKSGDNFVELILSLYFCVGPRDLAQVVSLM